MPNPNIESGGSNAPDLLSRLEQHIRDCTDTNEKLLRSQLETREFLLREIAELKDTMKDTINRSSIDTRDALARDISKLNDKYVSIEKDIVKMNANYSARVGMNTRLIYWTLGIIGTVVVALLGVVLKYVVFAV